MYIYTHTHTYMYTCILSREIGRTPGLHHKIPALKIFARGWVAQEPVFYTTKAKIFQGLGPKRRESCDGDRVYPIISDQIR